MEGRKESRRCESKANKAVEKSKLNLWGKRSKKRRAKHAEEEAAQIAYSQRGPHTESYPSSKPCRGLGPGWMAPHSNWNSVWHAHTHTHCRTTKFDIFGALSERRVEQYIRLIKQNLAISQVENLPNDNKYRAEKTHVKLNRKNNNHVWKKH